jgi:hypothetical protein
MIYFICVFSVYGSVCLYLVQMETILRHCHVMNPKDFRDADNAGDDVFYCEYEYDIHWHNFKRVADIDDEPEVDVHNLYDSQLCSLKLRPPFML